jgi:C4-type Zn-finger protein
MIGCPSCGAQDYYELSSQSTLAYFPPRIVNGRNVNPDRNRITTLCQCNVCGDQFRKAVAPDGIPYTVQEVRSE